MPAHLWRLTPRFGELDPYNHVNHAVYVSYFEAARSAALVEAGLALPDLAERDVQIIVTQLAVRFVAPATARDELEVRTEVAELRRASSRWHQRIVRLADGALMVEGEVTAAVCDNRGKPRRPPADLMEKLERLTAD